MAAMSAWASVSAGAEPCVVACMQIGASPRPNATTSQMSAATVATTRGPAPDVDRPVGAPRQPALGPEQQRPKTTQASHQGDDHPAAARWPARWPRSARRSPARRRCGAAGSRVRCISSEATWMNEPPVSRVARARILDLRLVHVAGVNGQPGGHAPPGWRASRWVARSRRFQRGQVGGGAGRCRPVPLAGRPAAPRPGQERGRRGDVGVGQRPGTSAARPGSAARWWRPRPWAADACWLTVQVGQRAPGQAALPPGRRAAGAGCPACLRGRAGPVAGGARCGGGMLWVTLADLRDLRVGQRHPGRAGLEAGMDAGSGWIPPPRYRARVPAVTTQCRNALMSRACRAAAAGPHDGVLVVDDRIAAVAGAVDHRDRLVDRGGRDEAAPPRRRLARRGQLYWPEGVAQRRLAEARGRAGQVADADVGDAAGDGGGSRPPCRVPGWPRPGRPATGQSTVVPYP